MTYRHDEHNTQPSSVVDADDLPSCSTEHSHSLRLTRSGRPSRANCANLRIPPSFIPSEYTKLVYYVIGDFLSFIHNLYYLIHIIISFRFEFQAIISYLNEIELHITT